MWARSATATCSFTSAPGGAGEHRREDQEHQRRQQEGHHQRGAVAPEIQRHHLEHGEAHAARLVSAIRVKRFCSEGRRTRISRTLTPACRSRWSSRGGEGVAVAAEAASRRRTTAFGARPSASRRLSGGRRGRRRSPPAPPSARRTPRRSASPARPRASAARRSGTPRGRRGRPAWSRSWVMIRIATPSPRSARSTCPTASRAGGSTPDGGLVQHQQPWACAGWPRRCSPAAGSRRRGGEPACRRARRCG